MATIEKISAEKVYGNDGNPDVIGLIGAGGKRILDIGCGNGANASRLASGGHVVDGISISEKELEVARPWLKNGYLHNLEHGLPEIEANTYDVVICSHVLEHIAYPDKLLADIRKVLKKDGHLIVALPNVMFYKFRLELLKGNFKTAETGIWDYTHLRWYTYASGKQLLEQRGFVVEVATVTGELPLNSLWKRVLPQGLRKKLFSGLKGVSKGLFGFQLLYKAGPGK